MDKNIILLLTTLENNGFTSYIIGGFVRDYLLGIKSFDVDIATSATPLELSKLWNGKIEGNSLGSFKLKLGEYTIDFTTFRKELSYTGRIPKVEYCTTLEEDIIRRDFTMNAIAMDKEGKIIDLLGGLQDLQNKKIKSIGDADSKMKEDPLRILRSLRFTTLDDFTLDKKLVLAIKKNKKLLKNISLVKVKEEFDKILISKNAIKTLKYMHKLGILKVFHIKYKRVVKIEDINGMYAQMSFPQYYPFTKKEKNNQIKIQKILKYGKIDNNVLYYEDFYYVGIASKILGFDYEKVSRKYKNLPIHKRKEIEVTPEEILEWIPHSKKEMISKVYLYLEDLILNKKVVNQKEILKKYITRRKWKNNG